MATSKITPTINVSIKYTYNKGKGYTGCGFSWVATWSVLWVGQTTVNGKPATSTGSLSGSGSECGSRSRGEVIHITASGYGRTVEKTLVIAGKGLCKC